MNAEYDENNRKIDLELNLNFLEDQTQRDNRIAVYILEDSVVGYQKWYRHEPEDIEDYVHHNVLRGSMNGTWGQTITDPSVNLSYSVSAEEKWRMNKIKLLAIVYDNNDKSILNVEWIELEAEAVVEEEKEIEFEGMSKDTVIFSGFGSTELAWDCELKNISEKEIELQVGYKVLKHQVGHNVSMCVLACFPVENNEFISPNLITLYANEATQKYDIVMHVEVKPNDILTKGETQVEFFAYPKGKIEQKITKIITYIAK